MVINQNHTLIGVAFLPTLPLTTTNPTCVIVVEVVHDDLGSPGTPKTTQTVGPSISCLAGSPGALLNTQPDHNPASVNL